MTKVSGHLSAIAAYRLSAEGHADAAKSLHHCLVQRAIANTDATWLALQSVIGFAVETALKADLAANALKRHELRRSFGHDLGALPTGSVELGPKAECAAVGQPDLVNAPRRDCDPCGPDFRDFTYRYLESESVQVLSPGAATTTAISVVECVIPLADRKAAAATRTPDQKA